MSEQKAASANGGGYLTFGPFFAGGNYSRATTSGSTQQDLGYHWNEQEMVVPGMQLAGYKCHILSNKCPDPLPSITEWI